MPVPSKILELCSSGVNRVPIQINLKEGVGTYLFGGRSWEDSLSRIAAFHFCFFFFFCNFSPSVEKRCGITRAVRNTGHAKHTIVTRTYPFGPRGTPGVDVSSLSLIHI